MSICEENILAEVRLIQHILLKKNYDCRNSWNLKKSTIIVIISKSGQAKTFNEWEAGKNAS